MAFSTVSSNVTCGIIFILFSSLLSQFSGIIINSKDKYKEFWLLLLLFWIWFWFWIFKLFRAPKLLILFIPIFIPVGKGFCGKLFIKLFWKPDICIFILLLLLWFNWLQNGFMLSLLSFNSYISIWGSNIFNSLLFIFIFITLLLSSLYLYQLPFIKTSEKYFNPFIVWLRETIDFNI